MKPHRSSFDEQGSPAECLWQTDFVDGYARVSGFGAGAVSAFTAVFIWYFTIWEGTLFIKRQVLTVWGKAEILPLCQEVC